MGSNTNIRTAFRLNRTVAIPCYKGLYLFKRIFDVGITEYAKEKCLECALDVIYVEECQNLFFVGVRN